MNSGVHPSETSKQNWGLHRDRTIAIGSWVAIAGAYAYLVLMASRRIASRETGDFFHFYDAAWAMIRHQDLYSSGAGGYIYPPLLAFLYMPLAHLSRATAAWVALGMNTAMALTATILLGRIAIAAWSGRSGACDTRHASGRWHALAGVSVVAAICTGVVFDKLKGELQMWQTNTLLLLLCSLFLTWLPRRPTWAGLCLGMAINVKYLPIVAVPWLIARGRWRALGGLVIGVILFAALPAVWTGVAQNIADLKVAFSGVLRIMGVPVGPVSANVEALTIGYSVSITSAFARMVSIERTPLAMAMSGAVAVATALILAWMYVRGRVSLWGSLDGTSTNAGTPNTPQVRSLGRLDCLEFAGLMLLALAFGPQTNPRHLVLLMPFVAVSAGGVVAGSGALRWRCGAGLALLVAGLNLPPGVPSLKEVVDAWRWIAGISWISLTCLLWVVYAMVTRPGLIETRRASIIPAERSE